jgi:hypothetical protein
MCSFQWTSTILGTTCGSIAWQVMGDVKIEIKESSMIDPIPHTLCRFLPQRFAEPGEYICEYALFSLQFTSVRRHCVCQSSGFSKICTLFCFTWSVEKLWFWESDALKWGGAKTCLPWLILIKVADPIPEPSSNLAYMRFRNDQRNLFYHAEK